MIFDDPVIRLKLIVSAVFLVAAVLVRMLIQRLIVARGHAPVDVVRRRTAFTRNFFLFVIVIGFAMIWMTQLRDLALSVTAVAVAFVIATKEMIICVLGGFARSVNQLFKVGDRIEVDNGMTHVRGDVIDVGLLHTTLLEIGPKHLSHQYTGRAIFLPNSLFLSQSIVNETFTEDYVLHIFTVPMKRTDDWRRAEKYILEASGEVCEEYLDDAQSYMEKISSKKGLDVPNVKPRVTLQFPDSEQIELLVRIPTPSRLKGRVEQKIMRIYLDKMEGAYDNS